MVATPSPDIPDARAQEAARQRLWAELAESPFQHSFYQALRRIESAHRHLPRLGEAVRPSQEAVRVGQPAELTFAPVNVTALVHRGPGAPWLMQRAFGLLGPNGPLPIHLTEYARERANQHADPALLRFLDHLTHRFALLFYRAWAQAQPALSLDRPDDTRYTRWLGSLFGDGNETQLGRDAAGDSAKLHFAGRLARQTRDADGLLAWLRAEFDVPIRIEQWCGHWMALGRDERTRVQRRGGQPLGGGAVLGSTCWDVQHKFRIVVGPLRLARHRAFLPDGRDLARLQAMVRQWVGLEFDWDVRLVLDRTEVPRMILARDGTAAPLGRTSWLGHYRRTRDADDLVIDVERTLRRRRPPASPMPPPS